jgi:hypothetical protein
MLKRSTIHAILIPEQKEIDNRTEKIGGTDNI